MPITWFSSSTPDSTPPPKSSKMEDPTVHDVVIIGGSLTGLLHGIVQKNLGRSVIILESSRTSQRASHATGIGCREKIIQLFKNNDISLEDLGGFVAHLDGYVVQTSGEELRPKMRVPYGGVMTAWNAMYWRLRRYFDGWVAEGEDSMVNGVGEMGGCGRVEYRTGIKVTGLHYDKKAKEVLVGYDDLNASESGLTLRASLVIAADGSNSIIRRQFVPNMPERKYAGYILWRGTYPVRDITQASTELTRGAALYMLPRLKTYAVIYQIPPDNGSFDPTDRLVNFAWYDWCPEGSPLYKLAMTDTKGYQHRFNVPRGQLNPAAWSHQVQRAKQIMHPAASDMVEACATDPFVTAISECISPQVTFFDNHVVLSGEALAVARPHSGAALNESARQAIMLGEVVKGERTWSNYANEAWSWTWINILVSRQMAALAMYSRPVLLWRKVRVKLAIWAYRIRKVWYG